ncbi:MAG: hypothetical protein Q7J73_06045 [Dehalococcoidales bacterium]|nr:hypothetical protein [Dehalococcoidales bacterium]
MKIKGNAAIISALVSDALAWVAFLWLLLWPYSYRGVSITATILGGPAGQITETHTSLLAVNGLRVILPLLFPVVITALLLLMAVSSNKRVAKLTAWPLAAILLGFCVLSGFSIGMSYIPAALVSIVTAILLLRRKTKVETS